MRVLGINALLSKLERAYPEANLHIEGESIKFFNASEVCDRTEMPLFSYFTVDAQEKNYTLCIRNHFYRWLQRNGWYAEIDNPEVISLYLI